MNTQLSNFSTISFNGTDLSSIYFNGTLVWSLTTPWSEDDYTYATYSDGTILSILIEGELESGKIAKTNLVTLKIGNKVTSLSDLVLLGCGTLSTVTISDNVTSIGEDAFSDCWNITSISIPSNVTFINGNAFNGCSSLASILVNSANTHYDSRDNCNAIIETASNTLITGCANTTIPNSVMSIGDYACCFIRLTSITIPSSVTTIGERAFEGCSELTDITCNAIEPPQLGSNCFDGISSLAKIYVPSESVDAYKSATNWSTYADQIEAIS